MKVRNGFISNSSSSSFIITKEDLTEDQLTNIYWFIDNDVCSWNIIDEDSTMTLTTSCVDYNLSNFLNAIGINNFKETSWP